jgi:hypothetical protein
MEICAAIMRGGLDHSDDNHRYAKLPMISSAILYGILLYLDPTFPDMPEMAHDQVIGGTYTIIS